MTLLRPVSMAVTALVLGALGACSAPDPMQPRVPQTTSAEAYGPAADTPGSSPQANWTQSPPQAPHNTQTTGLTDDQILQAVHIANTGGVDQGKVAQTRAKSQRVKRFASAMVRDHLDADTKGYEITKNLKLTPADSPLGTRLHDDDERSLAQLQAQNGANFDRAYIDAQVIAQKDALEALDTELLPSAKNSEVRAHLQTVRGKIELHLREAQSIQSSLSAR